MLPAVSIGIGIVVIWLLLGGIAWRALNNAPEINDNFDDNEVDFIGFPDGSDM